MTFSMPFNKATRMRALTIGVLALGLLSVQVGRGTLAFFTTQATSSANQFTAGTLTLNMNDGIGTPGQALTSSMTLANMVPGDSVYAPLDIENAGSLDALYTFTYATVKGTHDLAPGLTFAVKEKITGASNPGCTSVSFGDGTFPVSLLPVAGLAIDSAVPAALETSTALVSGAKHHFCLQIVFTDPGSLDNTYNATGTSSTVSFTVNGLISATPAAHNVV